MEAERHPKRRMGFEGNLRADFNMEKETRKCGFSIETEKESNWSQDQATKKSSYKEHRVDAMAPYAEEGRGKLR